jgi:hypothetical protein
MPNRHDKFSGLHRLSSTKFLVRAIFGHIDRTTFAKFPELRRFANDTQKMATTSSGSGERSPPMNFLILFSMLG